MALQGLEWKSIKILPLQKKRIMDSKIDLIERLLNLGDDWEVVDILINEPFKEIDLFLRYRKKTAFYPGQKKEYKIYDYAKERRVRHLDILDYKTYFNMRVPRVKNNKSEISIIELDWADKRVGYTYQFEERVLFTLLLSKNQTKTADYLDTTFDIVHNIMERAVDRGLKRRDLSGILGLCIDEKSYKKGHNYLTILSDPITKSVLDVIDGRTTESTQELLSWTLSPSELEQVLLVSMDMWKPYMNAVKEIIPKAEIVHDKYHVAAYLNKAVDQVRRKEVKKQEILKKSRFLFFKNEENWTESQRWKFEQINEINLDTSKAWKIKENFKGIYMQGDKQLCLRYFEQWYENTLELNIQPMIKVADTMLRHLDGIINSAFTHVTNSIAEGINSQIQVIKTVARGFANPDRYRNAILFFQGNLRLFPL